MTQRGEPNGNKTSDISLWVKTLYPPQKWDPPTAILWVCLSCFLANPSLCGFTVNTKRTTTILGGLQKRHTHSTYVRVHLSSGHFSRLAAAAPRSPAGSPLLRPASGRSRSAPGAGSRPRSWTLDSEQLVSWSLISADAHPLDFPGLLHNVFDRSMVFGVSPYRFPWLACESADMHCSSRGKCQLLESSS